MQSQVITEEMVAALAKSTDGQHGYEELLCMFRAQEFLSNGRHIFRDDIYGINVCSDISRMLSAVLAEYRQYLEEKNNCRISPATGVKE